MICAGGSGRISERPVVRRLQARRRGCTVVVGRGARVEIEVEVPAELPYRGWLAGDGTTDGVIVTWSPRNTVSPLLSAAPAWFTALMDATAGAFTETQDIGIT